jgi:hypothetical protein
MQQRAYHRPTDVPAPTGSAFVGAAARIMLATKNAQRG